MLNYTLMANIGRFEMNTFIEDCKSTIESARDLLKKNIEWSKRFGEYAQLINENLENIKHMKHQFHTRSQLHIYMNLSEAKNKMTFSLRYLGQEVANLKVVGDNITISTSTGHVINNNRDFGCNCELKNCKWLSEEATNFGKYFASKRKRTDYALRNYNEHRLESLLLTEFSKRNRKDKCLCNIQPVQFAGVARFQMPTPLMASKQLGYAKDGNGGGIDILCRIGTGKTAKLCIMELKDEITPKETPAKAIQQGLAYATFIRELLRSKSGETWWRIFGFNGSVPNKLELYVACVMPSKDNYEENDRSFKDEAIQIPDEKSPNDFFHLHYIYFKEENNTIISIDTSIKECQFHREQ